MTTPGYSSQVASLAGRRVLVIGRLTGTSRREVEPFLKVQKAVLVRSLEQRPDLIVVRDDEPLPPTDPKLIDLFKQAAAQAAGDHPLAVLSETQLWQLLGRDSPAPDVRRLHTPASLAELVGVPLAVVRRWQRRKLLVPVEVIHGLPYYDFAQVASARRLAEMVSRGLSAEAMQQQLAELARHWPDARQPLAQLSLLVEGQRLLLRHADGLVDSAGQLHFTFSEGSEAGSASRSPADAPWEGHATGAAPFDHAAGAPVTTGRGAAATDVPTAADTGMGPASQAPASIPMTPRTGMEFSDEHSAEQLAAWADELDDSGESTKAAEMYRAALSCGGPNAGICFRLAEVLYRRGELAAARERYYMAVEIQADYVEALANLGCLLTEMGDPALAVAAFQGALKFHPDYLDVHYHLAQVLDECGQPTEAETHWRRFVELARPLEQQLPWLAEAEQRLASAELTT